MGTCVLFGVWMRGIVHYVEYGEGTGAIFGLWMRSLVHCVAWD